MRFVRFHFRPKEVEMFKKMLVAIVAAGAAVLSALPAAGSAATPAHPLPYGSVDDVYNGVAYYSSSDPTISGWAIDGVCVNMVGCIAPIPVRADVTWYKRSSSICAICTASVVGQASFTQTANLFRTDLPKGNSYHGFSFRLTPPSPFTYDSVKACVTAFGYWGSTSLGCYAVVFQPI